MGVGLGSNVSYDHGVNVRPVYTPGEHPMHQGWVTSANEESFGPNKPLTDSSSLTGRVSARNDQKAEQVELLRGLFQRAASLALRAALLAREDIRLIHLAEEANSQCQFFKNMYLLTLPPSSLEQSGISESKTPEELSEPSEDESGEQISERSEDESVEQLSEPSDDESGEQISERSEDESVEQLSEPSDDESVEQLSEPTAHAVRVGLSFVGNTLLGVGNTLLRGHANAWMLLPGAFLTATLACHLLKKRYA